MINEKRKQKEDKEREREEIRKQKEAERKAKLANPIYSPVVASQGKQTVKEYLEEWVEK